MQVGWTTETKYYRTFGTTHYRCVLNYLKVCTLDIVNSIIFGQLDTQNWIFCGNDIVSISADIFFRHCCHIYNKCCVKVKTFQNSFELFLKWDHIKDKSPINMFIGNFLWIRLKKTKEKKFGWTENTFNHLKSKISNKMFNFYRNMCTTHICQSILYLWKRISIPKVNL